MPIDFATFGLSVVTAGGGAAVIAFGIFKGFGAKWMDARFAAQLEAQKQVHATETEHLRFRIAGLLDRVTKLNQREFEVLPDIWAKADEAHHHATAILSRWRSYPDFSRLGPAQFEGQLQVTSLEEWQREEMRGAPVHERNSYYAEAMRWIEIHHAKMASYEFSNALSKSSIYLHLDTYERINAFAVMVFQAVRDWQIDAEMRVDGESLTDGWDATIVRYRTDGEASFQALGTYLRQRYWNVGPAPVEGV
jgi:hypothetical protein